ncbi:MAG: potassium/proton antiporter [Actinomycetota bacterium]
MIESMNAAILTVSGLVALSIFSSLLSFRIGAPLLLVFLGVGLLAGGGGVGALHVDDPNAAYLVGSVALAVILFDSGFHTRLKTFRAAAWPALALSTLGVLVSASVVGVAAHFVLGLGPVQSLLLGAIVSPTDAAAVFFLLRVGGIHVRDRVRSTLEIESGSNDPMAIFLTLALVDLLAHGGAEAPGLKMAAEFVLQMGVGLGVGLSGGMVIVLAVNKLGFERGLQPLLALAMALVIFALAGMLHGSGFLAVYAAGLVAGNARLAAPETMRRFQDGMTWLAQIAMFLTLGLMAVPSELPPWLPAAVVVAVVLAFVARPLAVWLCLAPFRFNRNETAFVAWVGLRGAVSILLSILPMAAGLEQGRVYFAVAFLVVLMSLAMQGWTIGAVARFLGQVVPRRIGPVHRMELEIPGARHELVAYRIVADSLVAQGHRLPRWAVPSLVVRERTSYGFHAAGALRPGDMVYLFARPEKVAHLDRLFASPAVLAEADRQFFGDFALPPSTRMRELALTYGLPVPADAADLSVAEWLRRELKVKPGIGDRAPLGEVELIVRSLFDDGAIAEIGLAVEPTPIDKPRLPLFQGRRDLKAALKRRFPGLFR